MALTWTLAQIRAKVREITGELTEENISDSDLNDKINDFYRNIFPFEVYVAELDDWFTQVTASGDDGEYDVSQDVVRLDTPMTLKDSNDILSTVKFYQDKDEFFHLYPQDPNAAENRPAAMLLYGGVLYPGPKADAVYTFKAACIKKPDELSTDDSVPLDVRWGPAIAYGTAIEIKMEDQDKAAADELIPICQYFLRRISQKKMMQIATNQRATPRF